MLTLACLIALVTLHTGLRVLGHAFSRLELDPWDVLVYLGLAELHES